MQGIAEGVGTKSYAMLSNWLQCMDTNLDDYGSISLQGL